MSDLAGIRWGIAGPGAIAARWVVDPGTYDLVVAASATDERFRLPHEIVTHE